MSIKCSGAEFKKFYGDDEMWEEEAYHEGLEICVNGETLYDDGFNEEVLKDTDSVEIIDGFVYLPSMSSSSSGGVGLDKFFRKWRKVQDTETLVVTVDKQRLPYLLDAIKGVVSAKIIK